VFGAIDTPSVMDDSTLRILLIEDNTGDAALLEMALVESHYGQFEVAHARRLSEAFLRLEAESFDAILLDLGLPDAQGLQTLEKMRAKSAQLPIVVLTGLADDALALRAMQQGAQDYLVKSEVERGLVARAMRYVIERTRAERASQEARQQLELAVNAAQIGIWDWDLKKDRITWSPLQARILGVEGRECCFETFNECLHPDDRAETHKQNHDAVASHEAFRHEYRVIWSDRSIHWIEGRGRATYDDQGNPLRVMGTVIDITQQKAAEQALKLREAELAHLDRVTTMGQMASGLAHELNQPIGAIMNYAGVCVSQMKSANGSRDKINTALDELMAETRRAGEIIKRIREFVHKRQPQTQPIDLNQMVERSIGLMRFELQRRHIATEIHLARQLPVVMADAVQLEQVLVNLIYNAADAMEELPTGAARLTIRTACDLDSNQAVVTVTDTGPGISTENVKKLFDPFFTTKPNGLGMGLNISRSIIESHGGRLTAAPNPQGGAQFTFTLPVESTESAEAEGLVCQEKQA
jgi:PAS domain S-box-containing protein